MTNVLKKLIVGIDKRTADEALPLLDELAEAGVTIVKIGPVLMLNMGLYVLAKELSDRGLDYFLDGKFCNTDTILGDTAVEACRHSPTMLNCMADAGKDAIELFADRCRAAGTLSLVVSFLTTKDDDMCRAQHNGRTAQEQVLFYAHEWIAPSGADGMVCSAQEAPALRESNYEGILVTPGIRFKDTAKGDQKRVTTPAQAFQNRVDYVVMATDILADPAARVKRFVDEVSPVIG